MSPNDEVSGPQDPGREPSTRERRRRFWLIVKVVELRLRFIALMAITALVFAYWDTLANYLGKYARPEPGGTIAVSDIEFYCPMHPSIVRAEPGLCPICGMPLSKRKKGERATLPQGVLSRLRVAPDRMTQAGIRTVSVDYAPMVQTLSTVGYVEFDERRLARISSKLKGTSRIETLFVNFNGTPVRAGEPLAELYNAELYQAIQETLLARRMGASSNAGPSPLGRGTLANTGDLLRSSREKLMLWGLSGQQVDQFLERGAASAKVAILSPISGVVVRKYVVSGQVLAEGEAMFEVADLDHLWIQAQVYESQLGLVRVGQTAETRVDAYPGRVFKGQVRFIDPVLDPTSRTLNVRVDVENLDHALRPGMFVNVRLAVPVVETPAFRARMADRRPSSDLSRRVSLTVEEQQNCLVNNAKLGSMGEPIQIEVSGRKIWICCEGCAPKIKAEPARYLAKLVPPPKESVLSVPESAVIDTGERKVVYIESEPGVFEGRAVILGPLVGDRYPVLDGLGAGDRVAAAGAFLIDAETRLNPATAGVVEGGESTESAADGPHPAVSPSTPVTTTAPAVHSRSH